MIQPEQVFLLVTPVDMRWSIERLSLLVQQTLGRSPCDGTAYGFTNRSYSRLKLLIWDGNAIRNFSCIDWINFGQQVKASRSLLGLSRDELAKATRLVPATTTRIEEGAGDVGTPNAGSILQNFLERNGIEFPNGTYIISMTLISMTLHDPKKMQDQNIAVTVDPSMPASTRFIW